MKKILLLAAASAILTQVASADTSYLLLQGPFGSGSATETFEWQVNYAPGALTTGLDLLNAVFGAPVDTHTTYQGHEVYAGSNTIHGQTLGVDYIDFGSGGSSLFAISFTLAGTTILQDPSFDPGWISYVAGGSGFFNGGPYASGSWTFSNDGVNTRSLANGSFDGWVFGENGFDTTDAQVTGVSPTPADFANAAVVNVGNAPEPASTVLLAAGGMLLFGRRRQNSPRSAGASISTLL